MYLVIPLECSLTTRITEVIMRIIKNTSVYETRILKSLFCLVHNQLAKSEGRLRKWKSLRVKIRGGKRRTSGYAYFPVWIGWRGHGYDMFLTLSENSSLERISQVFAHELMHNYGNDHRQMARMYPLEKHHIDVIKEKFSGHFEGRILETVRLTKYSGKIKFQ